MWVDNFVSRCLWTLFAVFTHLYQQIVKERTLVGAEIAVRWSDTGHSTPCYASFSREPDEGDDFDDYGVPTSEVCHYFTGISHLMKSAWRGSNDEWRVVYCELIYATPVDSI